MSYSRKERKDLQSAVHMARVDNRITDEHCDRLCKLVERESRDVDPKGWPTIPVNLTHDEIDTLTKALAFFRDGNGNARMEELNRVASIFEQIENALNLQ